jgi:hypothetical protein
MADNQVFQKLGFLEHPMQSIDNQVFQLLWSLICVSNPEKRFTLFID